MKKNCLKLIFIFVFLLTGCQSQTVGDSLPPIAHLGGGLEAFVHAARLPQWPLAVYGKTAYLGEGESLSVLDLSGPAQPARADSLLLPDILLRLETQAGHLYALRRDGLIVLALDDPLHPVTQSDYPFSRAVDMALDGDRLYLLGEGRGKEGDPYLLDILSLADPARPKRIEQLKLDDLPVSKEGARPGLLLAGGHLCLAAPGRWWAGRLQLRCALSKEDNLTFTAAPTDWDDPGGVVAWTDRDEGYAAIVDADSLDLIRLSDFGPVATWPLPEKMGTSTNRPLPMQVADNTLYLADGEGRIWSLLLADQTQAQWQMLAGALENGPKFSILSLALAGDRLYAAGRGRHDLLTLNLDGEQAGNYRSLYMPRQVVWADDVAYVLDRGQGLKIVSLTEPQNPYVVGAVDFEDAGGHYLAVEQKIVYVEGNQKLHLIDAANPSAPVERSTMTFSGPIVGVAAFAQTAYLALCEEGVFVIDASDPDAPAAQTATLPSQGCSGGLLAHDGRLYVADGDGGLAVFSLDNPLQPRQLNRYPWPTDDLPGYRLALANDYLYLSDGFDRLSVFSLADPARLQLVAALEEIPGETVALAAAGDWLYLADRDGLFRAINVSDPTRPRIRYLWPPDADPVEFSVGGTGVATRENRAVVVSENLGLYVFEIP